MKKLSLLLFVAFSVLNSFSQEDFDLSELKIDTDKMLIEMADGACACIDSITIDNQSHDVLSEEIKACIDPKVEGHLLAMQLMEALTGGGSGKKKNTIYVNNDKNSQAYKETYYKMERYLMDSCKSLKKIIAVNDVKNKGSMSKNENAVELYNEGVIYSDKEDYANAIKCYKKALAIDSVFAFAWDNLGLSYRKSGDYQNAVNAYKKSIEIDPKGKVSIQNMAVAYMHLKEYEKAIESYEMLKKLDENNPEIYYGIGQVYYSYLNNDELALQNMCKAYNLYVAINSPYRTDAEKIISGLYASYKEKNNEEAFFKILEENNISIEGSGSKKKKKK